MNDEMELVLFTDVYLCSTMLFCVMLYRVLSSFCNLLANDSDLEEVRR